MSRLSQVYGAIQLADMHKKRVHKNKDRSYKPFKGSIYNINSEDAVQEVETFLDSITNISGPVGMTVLQPTIELNKQLGRNAPIIVLLHDDHEFNGGCHPCDEKHGCLSLFKHAESKVDRFTSVVHFLKGKKTYTVSFVKVLKAIAKRGVSVDFFFEAWNYSKCERNSCQSALFDVRQELRDCAIKHSCYYSPVRVHLSDPRNKHNDCDIIIRYILKGNYKDFQKYVTMHYKEFTSSYILYLFVELLLIGPSMFLQTVFQTDAFFARYSVVYKQLHQLPAVIKDNICLKYHNYIQHLSTDVTVNKDPHMKALRSETITIQTDSGYLNFQSDESLYYSLRTLLTFPKYRPLRHITTWIGISATLDIYFLSRALKTPELNIPSQLSVLYAGDIRCIQLLMFLTQSTKYYTVTRFHYDIAKTKCIHVIPKQPESIKQTIWRLCDELEHMLHNNESSFYLRYLTCMICITPVFRNDIQSWFIANPNSLFETFV